MAAPQIIHYGDNHCAFIVGDRTWYFSYTTCVAYEAWGEHAQDRETGHTRIRRQSNYSKTTAKYMRVMGVLTWPKVTDDEFDKIAAS